MKKENIIILRSVFPKNNITYSIPPCRNPKTGQYPACVRRVNADGDMILSQEDISSGAVVIPEDKFFQVQDGTTFDLSVPEQEAAWECIKHSKLIAKSRDARDASGNLIIDGENTWKTRDYNKAMRARYGNAELYIEVPGREAERKVSKKKLIINACNYVLNDSLEGMITKAKLLGRDARNMIPADLTDFLIDYAERNPDRMIHLYTGDDMNLRLLLIDAIHKHVIVIKDGVYLYADSVVLGASDEAVISWMANSKNFKVLEMIKKETYPDKYADMEDTQELEDKDIIKTNITVKSSTSSTAKKTTTKK